MPALQVLPERQPKPLTGWSHVMSKIGQGLGQGLESGMIQGANLSLNQKMEALQDQRKLDYAKKAYSQQQEQMAPFLEQAEKETPGSRLAIQLMGPDKYAEMMTKAGPQYITNAFAGGAGQGAGQAGGFNNLQKMGPQRQMEAPNNQMVPIQDREAIDEQEMQQMSTASSQMQQQPQQITAQSARRSYDDFIADEMRNVGAKSLDRLSPDLLDKLNQRAERKFNAQEKALKTDIAQENTQYNRHKDIVDKNEKVSQPYLNDISAKEKKAAVLETAFRTSENAVRSGETTGLINWLAQKHNIDPMKNTDSAILNAAKKEFLLSNVTRAGSRPNMWLEQQVSSMFPSVGQSKESALGVLAMLDADKDAVKEEARIAREIQHKYEKELGYVPKSIEEEVNAQLIPFIDKSNEKLALKIQSIKEEKMSDKELAMKARSKVMKGTPLTERMGLVILDKASGDTKKAAKIAERLGYSIPEEGGK